MIIHYNNTILFHFNIRLLHYNFCQNKASVNFMLEQYGQNYGNSINGYKNEAYEMQRNCIEKR